MSTRIPVAELRRIWRVFSSRCALPGRDAAEGTARRPAPDSVMAMLLRPPARPAGAAAPDRSWTVVVGPRPADGPTGRAAATLYGPDRRRDRQAARPRPDRHPSRGGVRPASGPAMTAPSARSPRIAQRIRAGQLSPVALVADARRGSSAWTPTLSASSASTRMRCAEARARASARSATGAARPAARRPDRHQGQLPDRRHADHGRHDGAGR